jgi:hypothetical protein
LTVFDVEKQTQFYLAPRFTLGVVEKANLKKQSQFLPGQIGVSSYLKGNYGNITPRGARKNKANQACSFGKLGTGSERSRMEPIWMIKTERAGFQALP